MNNLLRLLVIIGIVACSIVVVTLGFARHDSELMAPVSLALWALGTLFYLLPTGIAIYRDCRSTVWIVLINILLGWTVLGWFAAMGWAAAGNVRGTAHPPAHPVPGH